MTPKSCAPFVLLLALGACNETTDSGGGGGTPTRVLESVSGADQVVAPGATLPQPIVVRLTENNLPVAGQPVQFSVGGGGVNPAVTNTGADGQASTSWTVANVPNTLNLLSVGAPSAQVINIPSFAVATNATLVDVQNNQFSPGDVTVPRNTTVVWIWKSSARGHNFTPDPGTGNAAWQAALVTTRDGPWLATFQFTQAGTYTYSCTQHAGMVGRVIVSP